MKPIVPRFVGRCAVALSVPCAILTPRKANRRRTIWRLSQAVFIGLTLLRALPAAAEPPSQPPAPSTAQECAAAHSAAVSAMYACMGDSVAYLLDPPWCCRIDAGVWGYRVSSQCLSAFDQTEKRIGAACDAALGPGKNKNMYCVARKAFSGSCPQFSAQLSTQLPRGRIFTDSSGDDFSRACANALAYPDICSNPGGVRRAINLAGVGCASEQSAINQCFVHCPPGDASCQKNCETLKRQLLTLCLPPALKDAMYPPGTETKADNTRDGKGTATAGSKPRAVSPNLPTDTVKLQPRQELLTPPPKEKAAQLTPGMAVDAHGRPIAPTSTTETKHSATVTAPVVATIPKKVTGPTLNAKGNEVSIEPLELSDGKISSQGGTSQSGKSNLTPPAPKLPHQTPAASARMPTTVQPAAKTALAGSTMKMTVSRIEPGYHHFAAPDAKQCQARCASEAQCKAWTWVKPGADGPAATCHLRNQVPKVVSKSDCCVSGVK
jgi:hypothetical protein